MCCQIYDECKDVDEGSLSFDTVIIMILKFIQGNEPGRDLFTQGA